MASEDNANISSSDCSKCVFCRLTSRIHTWRTQMASVSLQDAANNIRTFGGTVVEHSVGVYHRGVSYSRGVYSRAMPALRDSLNGTRQLTAGSTRDVVDTFKDYALVFFLYGMVTVLFLTLMFMPRSSRDEDLQVYVLAMLFPIIFFWLPCYCWRNGLFNLFRSQSNQEACESCSAQRAVIDKPPEYETLVFTATDPVSSVAPPTYEEAIPILEASQIPPPEYSSSTNIAVSLCPVHQQSSTRHPSVVQDTRSQRSK